MNTAVEYGSETEIEYLDDNGSTKENIKTKRAGDVKGKCFRFSFRILVHNPKEETTEYLTWSKAVDECRHNGLLVVDKRNPLTWPTFLIEHPKHSENGEYFVVRTHTQLIP